MGLGCVFREDVNDRTNCSLDGSESSIIGRELPPGLHPFILGTLRGDHQPIRDHLITKLGHVLSLRLRGRHADFCLSFEASFFLPLFSLFFPQSAEAPDHSTTGPVLGSMNRASLVGHVLMSMASSQRKSILR